LCFFFFEGLSILKMEQATGVRLFHGRLKKKTSIHP